MRLKESDSATIQFWGFSRKQDSTQFLKTTNVKKYLHRTSLEYLMYSSEPRC